VLLPEKMAIFRVAVPSEYEVSLINTLSEFGNTALRAGGIELHHIMPKLLIDVLEGWVSPSTLNMQLVLDTIKRVLRPGDDYRTRVERLIQKYYQLEKLEELVKRLESIGVSPDRFVRKLLKIKFDYVCVESEELLKATKEFRAIGVIVRRVRMDEHTYFLVLVYEDELREAVQRVKEKLSTSRINIPQWFYDKPQNVLARVEEEKNRIRKDIFDALVDIAEVMKDAIEYEKASKVGVLDEARKLFKEIKSSLDTLEDIVRDLVIASIARAVVEKGELGLLRKVKLEDEIVEEIIKLIKLDDKLTVLENIRSLIESSNADQSLKEDLDEVYLRFKRAYLRTKVLDEVVKRGYLPETLKGRLWIGAFFGEETEIKNFLEELSFYEVKMSIFDFISHKVLVAIIESEEMLNVIQNISERYPLLRIFIDVQEKPSELLTKFEDSLKREEEIVVGGIMLAFKKDVDLKKLVEIYKDEELKELAQKISFLKNELYENKPLPIKTITEFISFLKNLVDKADKVINEISNIKHKVSAEIDLILSGSQKVLLTYKRILNDVVREVEDVLSYERAVESMSKLYPALGELRVFRNKRITLVEGYVPVRYAEELRKTLEENIPRILYLKIREPLMFEPVPTYIRKRGLWKHLYALVDMLGTPNYREINPTLFLVTLFVIMYGLMFGDVGQGILIAIFGAWLLKTKYPLLGISREGAASLGLLALLSGISSTIFGILYGFLVFLQPLSEPLWIRPLHDIYSIIGTALLFGVVQLILAMCLSVVNYILYKDYGGAIFSGMGLMGIIYYLAGVYIVYNIVLSGYNFSIVMSPHVQPAVYAVILSLVSIIGYGLYESIKTGKTEKMMDAVTEILEMFIAYPANTLSYIRLAAFAMAHEAFGELAHILAHMTGPIISYTIANLVVLAIEGLGVGIQALRLTFYEFSTKFFRGEGIEFKPVIEFSALEGLKEVAE